MASTELVRLDQDRQIRSYHAAFTGELTIYRWGNDLRPWRPIPARLIFWTVGLASIAFVFAHALSLHFPFASEAWFLYYFIAPGGFGWLFARALVEGRRLHVVIASWARHAMYGRHMTGGGRNLGRRNRPLKATKIKVASLHRTRSPTPLWCDAVAAVVVAILLVIGISVSRNSRAANLPPRAHLPTGIVTSSYEALRVPRPIVSASKPHAVRRAAARHVVSPHRRAAARQPRRKPTARRAVPYAPVRTVIRAAPRVVASAPVSLLHAPIVHSDPSPVRSPTPPCYIGQLGCN